MPPWAAYAVVGGAFALSRVGYFLSGVRFDVSPIREFSQLLDPFLLRTRLAESLLYLHAQPPLYNLLTGLALKLAPASPARVLFPFFMACSLYQGFCLDFILKELGIPRRVAATLAAVIVASPQLALYESWYFYPHLNVTWLLGAVAWLAASGGRAGRAMLIAAAHLTGLVLTRSLFHPLFYLLATGLVGLLVERAERRRALACFVLPGLLVGALCLKNLALFGFAGTSSWASRNVCHAVSDLLGPERVKEAERTHTFTPAIHTDWFETGKDNARIFRLHLRRTRVPALDQNLKRSAPHLPNFNHQSYPLTQAFYAEDALALVRAFPVAYLRGVLTQSLPAFFRHVDSDWYFERNREAILPVARAFDRVETRGRAVVGLGLVLALWRAAARRSSRAERLVLAFALLAIVWVGVVGVLGEFGENYRFRYKVLWLTWVVAAAGYAAYAPAFARRLLARVRSPAKSRL